MLRPVQQGAEAERPDDILEAGAGLLEVQEFGRRKHATNATRLRVLNQDVDETIGVAIRQRIEHHVVDDAVDDRDGTDAEGEREDGNQRESRRVDECAHRVARVAPGIVQPHEGARVTLQFLHLLDAAECTPGSDSRLVRCETLCAEPVFEQREV